MPSSIDKKLRIREGMSLLTIHAPKKFSQSLSPLPANISISEKAKHYDQIHWFVQDKAQLENEVNKIIKLLKGDIICWCYYPKGTSEIQTDLTRDKGWESLLAKDIQWLSLISFNDTWSAFAFRLKTDADRKKEQSRPVREIFKYADPVKKVISLPEDLTIALKNNEEEANFFYSLSFTNRKEYVEWVITAKREETRRQRVDRIIERLSKKWKNPQNM